MAMWWISSNLDSTVNTVRQFARAGLSAPLALPPSVFHGIMACALDGGQAGRQKKRAHRSPFLFINVTYSPKFLNLVFTKSNRLMFCPQSSVSHSP